MKGETDKLDFRQNHFHSSKDTVKEMNRQTTNWEKIFTIYNLTKICVLGLYQETSEICNTINNNPQNF